MIQDIPTGGLSLACDRVLPGNTEAFGTLGETDGPGEAKISKCV